MPLSLDKLPPALRASATRATVSLEKNALAGHRARTALALDYSLSMRHLYASGRVQALAERVLALATRLDDDGAIDVYLFGTDAWYAGALTVDDFAGGVDRLRTGRMGRTNYAGAMHLIRDRAAAGIPLGNAGDPFDTPVYVVFVTDGAPTSRTAATRELVNAADTGIFWAFMGVTSDPADAKPSRFDYLRRLDSAVPGRTLDNASFFQADNLDQLGDDELYDAMLAEYPDWVRQARQHNMIR